MLMTLAACSLCLSPVIAAQSPAPAASQQTQEKEFSGAVESYDADSQTLKLKGVASEIVLTAETKFGQGLSVATLKPGTEIVVLAAPRADGKMEARQITTKA